MNSLLTIEEKVANAIEIAGINAPVQLPDDVDLSLYIEDSLQFVNLIITLEEILNITLPDEILLIDNFHSLLGLICMIKEIIADDIGKEIGVS